MKSFYNIPGTFAVADVTGIGEMVPYTHTITRINVKPERLRGTGLGTRLLQMIIEDADKDGVGLSLEINPSGPMDYNALEAWYKRHGFVPYGQYATILIRRAQRITS